MKRVTVKLTESHLKIYINSILHVAVKSKHLSFQSWIQPKKGVTWYYIELTGSEGSEWMKYDDVNLWKEIINKIDNVLK